MSTLVVYSTYYLNDSIKTEIERIESSGCAIIVSVGKGTWVGERTLPQPNVPIVEFDTVILPYIRKTVTARELWYNCEYHTIMAHKLFPLYDHYLYVEHDIRYAGDWPNLIENVDKSGCDGLFLYLWTKANKPTWNQWRSQMPKGCKTYFGSILALHMLSNSGVDYLDRCYQIGRRGYSEVSVPSLISDVGLKIGVFSSYGIKYDQSTCGWLSRGSKVVNWNSEYLYHPIRTIGRHI